MWVRPSLGTRPFAEGMLLQSSCPQDGILTWPIRITDCNDVMEMVILKAFSVANN